MGLDFILAPYYQYIVKESRKYTVEGRERVNIKVSPKSNVLVHIADCLCQRVTPGGSCRGRARENYSANKGVCKMQARRFVYLKAQKFVLMSTIHNATTTYVSGVVAKWGVDVSRFKILIHILC